MSEQPDDPKVLQEKLDRTIEALDSLAQCVATIAPGFAENIAMLRAELHGLSYEPGPGYTLPKVQSVDPEMGREVPPPWATSRPE